MHFFMKFGKIKKMSHSFQRLSRMKRRGIPLSSNSFKYSYKSSHQDNLSLSVYNVGYQRCEPEYSWGPGIRDHYLFHYVTEGRGTVQTPEGTFSIGPGCLFLIRPSEVVSYVSDKEEPWEYYWVGFNGTEAHRLINLTPFSFQETVLHLEDQNIRSLLVQIYDSRGNSSASEAKMLGALYQFLGVLIEKSELNQSKKTPTKQYIEQAIKFISRNFSSEISIEDVAKAVRISPSHLYRIFSSELGMPPAQFLIRYRINEACSILKNSNLSISEVAVSTGFSDPLYFSRAFKKVKGLSPRAYLKEVQTGK